MNIDHEIQKNKIRFHEEIEKLKLLRGNAKIEKLQDIANSAILEPIGQFSSSFMENDLLKIAQEHHIRLPKQREGYGVCHILTKSGLLGGHTRIVERWIEASPENERHSVILLTQMNPKEIPVRLRELVMNKNGDFLDLTAIRNRLDKGLFLRKMASFYETIILHVHMNDIVPMIAFGTEEFRPPVVYLNHADHLFWLGVSVSDLVVSIRQSAVTRCRKYRKTYRNTLIPLPAGDEIVKKTPEEVALEKEKLGLPVDAKVVVTIASSYKFVQIEGYDFSSFVEKLLLQEPKTYYFIIGFDPNRGSWGKTDLVHDRLIFSGEKNHEEIDAYLSVADLIIDSFPVSSFTSVLDAAKYGMEVLSLRTPVNQWEIFEEAGVYCETPDEMLGRSIDILQNRSRNESQMFQLIQRDHIKKSFAGHLKRLVEHIPEQHRLYPFEDNLNKKMTEFERFVFMTPHAPKGATNYGECF